ncbi:MAG: hypothetical protein ACJ751_02180, partial [Niastella sp.]|uniref:hypothetical protein n=1 Tax=Niastella sp. TaxID=1869183 RepID=UPI00389A66C0
MRKAVAAGAAFLLTAPFVMAEGGGHPPKESSLYDPFVVTMIIIMAILLLAIGLLANVVIGTAGYYYKKQKENEQQTSAGSSLKALSIIALLLMAAPSFAQDAAAPVAAVQTADPYNGLSASTFYCMVGVIAVELLVVFVLLYQLRVFLGKTKLQESTAGATEFRLKSGISVWHKLNKFKPIEQEADLDLGHDYDGIRELDN